MISIRRLARIFVPSALALSALAVPAIAKPKSKPAPPQLDAPKPTFEPSLYQELAWRNIGPFRGGRVTAVAGVPQEPMTFYFGATGGGVWKTTDGGTTWNNLSDGSFKTGSVGAIAVAPSDPNVVYVGMGESPVRGVATSHGDGVYRSTDAGKSWQHVGLAPTRHISRIRVHPQNPDFVYAAAQGSPWAPTPDRGIYRSKDGGKNWEKVLFVSEKAGASDLAMDPTNPRILYASFWQHRRYPWKIESGGPDSGIHRSTDGGDTWQKLSKGLPELMGKVRVDVSASKPERAWAMVEAEEGGLFRSDDSGKSWQRVNEDRELRGRAWYYMHVVADPTDADTVYVLNAPILKSIDGGKSFSRVSSPHGDNHALWIHPEHGDWMINGNDGGANVSFNGGATWSTQANQPTAQFYRVNADDLFPYTVYGGQQDNTSVAIKSAGDDGSIGREDWKPVGGCETAYVAFDPKNPVTIYAGCYHGQITRYDAETGTLRDAMAYPTLGLASTPSEVKYRFNWNAPIVASRHDPNTIYHGAQVLLKTADGGQSWTEISPDLTRNDKEKQGPGGGPITNEGAGGEVYGTIFYIAESPHRVGTPGVAPLWVGTDDGRVHLTRDGGTWEEVTPPELGEAQINAIELSPHDPRSAWVVATKYKLNDFEPYVYGTKDDGKTWHRIDAGLPRDAFARVLREDTVRPGLLYVGTETGFWTSFDGGASWQSLQLKLPVVPVTDLKVHGNDLVISTQGRSFWILDDVSPLRQLDSNAAQAALHLFAPEPASRLQAGGGFGGRDPALGRNPPYGAVIDYSLGRDLEAEKEELKLTIRNSTGEIVRELSSKPKQRDEAGRGGRRRGPGGPGGDGNQLGTSKGHHRVVWGLDREVTQAMPGTFWADEPASYRVAPGTYQLTLTLGDQSLSKPLEITSDPRLPPVRAEDESEHQRFLAAIAGDLDAALRSVKKLRAVRDQVEGLTKRAEELSAGKEIGEAGKKLVEEINALEEQLVQTKSKSFQDVINFPNRINAELVNLLGSVDGSGPPVTAGQRARLLDLEREWDTHEATVMKTLGEKVDAFNQLVADKKVPAVIVPSLADGEKAAVEK